MPEFQALGAGVSHSLIADLFLEFHKEAQLLFVDPAYLCRTETTQSLLDGILDTCRASESALQRHSPAQSSY